jgi:hypothetical protein
LPGTLLNPNKLHSNGVIVYDCPKHLAPDPSVVTHSIFVPEHNLRIPLQLEGVISCIPTHYPSPMELETCHWVELTSSEDWDPHANYFAAKEEQVQQRLDSIPVHQDRSIDLIVEFGHSLHSRVMASTSSTPRSSESLRNKIASTFSIGLETAQRALRATTQLALRNVTHPIHRRFQTEVAQLRYPRLGGVHGKFHTDTFFASVPLLSQATMGQMYTNDIHFSKFYPMQRRSQAPDTLINFMQDVGIPSDLHSDDAPELFQGRMKELVKKFWIKGSLSEPYSPWQVRAELCIREIKAAVRHLMSKSGAPKQLWDYCMKYQCELRNLIAHPHLV